MFERTTKPSIPRKRVSPCKYPRPSASSKFISGYNGTRRVTVSRRYYPSLQAFPSYYPETFFKPKHFRKTFSSLILSIYLSLSFCFLAYSCHGRWFDAEGTQFVIATPLTRRTTWSNENNRPQPYRNSRRLCFMYKESGGVVSLTASPVACQRGIPPPPPMLAFNATSTGECPNFVNASVIMPFYRY